MSLDIECEIVRDHAVVRARTHFVYPGQALVSCWALMHLFSSLDEASQKGVTFTRAEESLSPGAGGVNSSVLRICGRLRSHGDVGLAIEELREHWRGLTGGQTPYRDRVEEGERKAEPLVPYVRDHLMSWVCSDGGEVAIGAVETAESATGQ